MSILRERLADYAHTAWSGWMKYLFSKGVLSVDGTWTMPAWAVERWTRQMNTPYADLPDSERESDRKEADEMLAIVAPADPTPRIFDGAAAQLAAMLEQDAQAALDLLTVWEWATSERHWCDDVRLHCSGVHFEIAEPKEGKTKAERRPEIHRFTHYTSTYGSLTNALRAAAEFCRTKEEGASDHNRYAESMLPEPSSEAKAKAEAFETFLLMAGDRPLWDGGLARLGRLFDDFAAQRSAALKQTLEEWVAAYDNEPDYQRGVADVLAFLNGDIP